MRVYRPESEGGSFYVDDDCYQLDCGYDCYNNGGEMIIDRECPVHNEEEDDG